MVSESELNGGVGENDSTSRFFPPTLIVVFPTEKDLNL